MDAAAFAADFSIRVDPEWESGFEGERAGFIRRDSLEAIVFPGKGGGKGKQDQKF